MENDNRDFVPLTPDRIDLFRAVLRTGFVSKAIDGGNISKMYKAAIKFSAVVRRSMTELQCRRVSVELILDADDPDDPSTEQNLAKKEEHHGE